MIPTDSEKFHLYATIAQFFLIPALIWAIKRLGQSFLDDLDKRIDAKAVKAAARVAAEAKSDYESLKLQIATHDRAFAEIKERLDLLVHRTNNV
jgi:DhnA family fructose-bisphosphate aldolase class Ia